jgi:hypothetical protein
VHGARDGEVFPLARPVPSAEASALCWHPRCLLHESVIVAAIRIVARWHAPTGVNYPALVAVSFTAIPAIYELAVRRYRITPVPVRHETVSSPWDNDQSRHALPRAKRQLVGRS